MMETGVDVAGLLGVHDQRDVLEEAGQGLELVHGADQFLEVFQPAGAFGDLSSCHISV